VSIHEEVLEMERRLNDRVSKIEKLQQDNSVAIGQLTANVDRLTSSTQGIVDVWTAGKTLQKAIKWLSGFAIVVTLINWWAGKI